MLQNMLKVPADFIFVGVSNRNYEIINCIVLL